MSNLKVQLQAGQEVGNEKSVAFGLINFDAKIRDNVIKNSLF